MSYLEFILCDCCRSRIGKRFDITLSDSGLVYDVPVRVAAREKQKTILGNVWCYRLEPEVFGPGRMVEDKGSMSIWITDDARRIPVRSRIDTSFGRVEVRLRSVSTTPSLTASKRYDRDKKFSRLRHGWRKSYNIRNVNL